MNSETNLREYVVTLHQFDDLESFYTDMETEGENLYIPNRAVEVALRRPVSSNTHYMLSDQEAAQLRLDPRVLAVELTLEGQGLKIVPAWTQYSTRWSKSNATVGQLNWGLLRVTEGQHRPGWGYFTTTEVTGTATAPFSGKHVDVVILDGTVEAQHPEFAKNIDGTGGTRVIPYNWYELNGAVGAPVGTPADYPYTPADKYNDYHGTHVAGTAAGNTQGWARDANIYNMYMYGAFDPKIALTNVFDYVRLWHQNKAINPATGRKNPTIVNCSWIVSNNQKIVSWITRLTYRGTTVQGPFTNAQLQSYGIPVNDIGGGDGAFYHPERNAAIDKDISDCIADGIIVVAAAGNDRFRIDTEGGPDYNNTMDFLEPTYQIQGTFTPYRGSSPAAAPGVISVGAIGNYAVYPVGAALEEKAPYSNCGPRIDVFAPGSGITSAVNNNWKLTPTLKGGPDREPSVAYTLAVDSRNSNYKIVSINGTSMASPQVTGVLATMLEATPSMTPAAAKTYITGNAKAGQIYAPLVGADQYEFYGLQGAANRYVFAAYPTTISIIPSTSEATPLQTVSYTITMTGVPDGSLVYLTDSGTSISSDFVDGVRQFVLTVNGGTASLTRTVSAGMASSRTSILQLRTGGYDGNIQFTATTVTVTLGDFASNSGSITIDAQGKANFSITPRLDSVTEGAETFTVSLRTSSVSGNVVKTSDTITINASS
jgi:hypothetical protein